MHQSDRSIMMYAAFRERIHVSSTRCDQCRTCHQTIWL